MKRLFAGTLTAMLALSLTACGQQEQGDAKPVIYLYPEQETTVSVSLDYAGTLTATYPAYENGWTVTAEPDGTLYDENGDEYSYLFWEGENNTDYDFSKGFCVAGADTADFLREKLAEIGLTPREYNEFIVYWLPKMQDNPYNLISFQSEAYTDAAKLDIDPTPDSVLRVFMAWKPLHRAQTIEPQTFASFERNGFTVVEWGGCEVKEAQKNRRNFGGFSFKGFNPARYAAAALKCTAASKPGWK